MPPSDEGRLSPAGRDVARGDREGGGGGFCRRQKPEGETFCADVCSFSLPQSAALTAPSSEGASDCRKCLAEFAPAGANRVLIIFSGDMCVGENTSRLANVRAKRVRCGEPQPFQTRAQRSGSRLRACQKYFFDTLRPLRGSLFISVHAPREAVFWADGSCA